MCSECRVDYGSPKLDSLDIQTCAALIMQLYMLDNCGCGGVMHIITDDWNLEDEHLEFCREEANKLIDDYDQKDLAIRILDLMDEFTLDERASAMALFDGYIKFPNNVAEVR